MSIGSNMFLFPNYGLGTINNIRAWMYRKDIFEAEGLQPPKTMEELYQTCKILKARYPDSYPLAMRGGVNTFNVIGAQWKPYFEFGVYYDYNQGKFSFGAAESTMYDIITYFKRMYDEGLVPPDYLTINIDSWQLMINSNKGFIMPEYIVRIDYFNAPNRLRNPDYTWTTMAPPATPGVAEAKLNKTNWEYSGYVVCNTDDRERIDNAFKLVDWMYSPNGVELLSWGKEGETYRVAEDGTHSFILDGSGRNARSLYGVGTYGLFQVIKPEANEAMYSQENVEQAKKALTYLLDEVNPVTWLPLDITETSAKKRISEPLMQYTREQITKFLIGERSLDEWGAFQQELEQRGVAPLLEAYESAYKRVISQS